MSAVPPFPPAREPGPDTPAALTAQGLLLRHACDADLPRLRDVYADTRKDEMARVPWPDLVKRSFLDSQFALQHLHSHQHYAGTDFLVVEHGGAVQGRYYLLRRADADLIVDISLMTPFRGRGIGRALIEASQREARAGGRGMTLHVLHANLPAMRLYQRLGFALNGGTDTHHRMDWRGPLAS
mgnify:FL=1